MEQNKEQQPVKLTVTFGDGHTMDFDVFIAVVAGGLLPTKTGDRTCYTAMEEGFQSYGLTAIAADATIIVGLIQAFHEIMNSIMDSMDVHMAIEMLGAMSSLKTKGTVLYFYKQIIRKNSGEN